MVIPGLYDPPIGPKHLSWPGLAHYTAHVRPRIKPYGLDFAESLFKAGVGEMQGKGLTIHSKALISLAGQGH